MKRYQFVIHNPKTEEVKMRNIERRNIDEAMVDARIYARGEWEYTPTNNCSTGLTSQSIYPG